MSTNNRFQITREIVDVGVDYVDTPYAGRERVGLMIVVWKNTERGDMSEAEFLEKMIREDLSSDTEVHIRGERMNVFGGGALYADVKIPADSSDSVVLLRVTSTVLNDRVYLIALQARETFFESLVPYFVQFASSVKPFSVYQEEHTESPTGTGIRVGNYDIVRTNGGVPVTGDTTEVIITPLQILENSIGCDSFREECPPLNTFTVRLSVSVEGGPSSEVVLMADRWYQSPLFDLHLPISHIETAVGNDHTRYDELSPYDLSQYSFRVDIQR